MLSICLESCKHFSEKVLLRFLSQESSDGTFAEETRSGETLYRDIARIGYGLSQKLEARSQVVLLLPQGIDYPLALLGCWWADLIAIPMPLVEADQLEGMTTKLKGIFEDSESVTVIVNDAVEEAWQSLGLFPSVAVLNINHLISVKQAEAPRVRDVDQTALLLYTSGSTSSPKGVVISHRQLSAQARTGALQWGMTRHSQIVSWMPQFHNFGLHFNLLAPLLKGATSTIFSPAIFVQSPELWLEWINQYQATHTGAPNFAFDYCLDSIDPERLEDCSLNSLKAVICGGEPIRKVTLDRFHDVFEPFGLNRMAFCSHYGLSEAGSVCTKKSGTNQRFLSLSLADLEDGKITKLEPEGNESQAKQVISCGLVNKALSVKCVEPETGRLTQPGRIGEIWLKAPSVAGGYLNKKTETEATFNGCLANGEAGYLRTGDLGFIEKRHLYVVGRIKDVMIVHGKNHHPQDLEETIREHIPEIEGNIAVFSLEQDDVERVIAVIEVMVPISERGFKTLTKKMLLAVSTVHKIDLHEIAWVPMGDIPKTGSGKIQRRACKQALAQGKMELLYHFHDGVFYMDQEEPQVEQEGTEDLLQRLNVEVIAKELNLDSNALDGIQALGELGVNSLQYVRIARRIEKVFNILISPVILFKSGDLQKLVAFLADQIGDSVSTPVQSQEPRANISVNASQGPIAIIGMSCHFPGGADDPASFWDNLIAGKDCIQPIHQARPQMLKNDLDHYGPQDEAYPKWGGFLENVASFDAKFFRVSPREAESMDPQQRKSLELVWRVLEASGYNPLELAGGDIGLFMGVHSNNYAELVTRQPGLIELYGAFLDSGLHTSMIAHRVSRWFDFHGPSEVINTACSSSLVALQHAVNALYRGDCNLAIAGGINLILTSRTHRVAHKAGMLAADGRCRTFDERATGMVRSEGMGAVVLKPLSQALADGDRVYGIVRGVAVNHDGQSTSLRSPNLESQKQVIRAAYQEADICPSTVSFIEAHGTGTSLGDPIEVQALKDAFAEGMQQNQASQERLQSMKCGLGATKTIIGHSESAAGIAGVIKVLLAMQHQTLPKTLHFNKLNPYLQLDQSPFYVVEENQPWTPFHGPDGRDLPRRAGVSSFGFGGVNAHAIIEEFTQAEPGKMEALGPGPSTFLIPLSARTPDSLKAAVQRLLSYLERMFRDGSRTERLSDIAFTLQQGRNHMAERVLFLVESFSDLHQKLMTFKDDTTEGDGVFIGMNRQNPLMTELLIEEEDSRGLVAQWVQSEKWSKIAQFWVCGGTVPWSCLYEEAMGRRIELPTYCFSQETFWLPSLPKGIQVVPSDSETVNWLHPLLHLNTSDLREQRFSTTFNGREFFFRDHRIFKRAVLPGAAYLEMAREAVYRAAGLLDATQIGESATTRLRNVVWSQPILAAEDDATGTMENQDGWGVPIHIGLFPEESGAMAFEVYSFQKGKDQLAIHGQGLAQIIDQDRPERRDIEALKATCHPERMSAERVYAAFAAMGIDYGESHRGIYELAIGDGIVMAHLQLPEVIAETQSAYMLHPSMVDAAFQASIGLTHFGPGFQVAEPQAPAIPFSLEQVDMFAPCSSSMWVVFRPKQTGSAGNHLRCDLELLDDQGHLCVRMNGLILRVPSEADLDSWQAVSEEDQTVLLQRRWVVKPALKTELKAYDDHLVLICPVNGEGQLIMDDGLDTKLQGLCAPRAHVHIIKECHDCPADRFSQVVTSVFTELRTLVLENRRNTNGSANLLVQMVVLVVPGQMEANTAQGLLSGLSGLLKTAAKEFPWVTAQLIESDRAWPEIADILRVNASSPDEDRIRHCSQGRMVSRWEELPEELNEPPAIPWKNGGIYLITGGVGGLGLIVAREIAERVNDATIILLGRSSLSDKPEASSRLDALRALGTRIIYRQVDVTDLEVISQIILETQDELGSLNGIIHSAGLIRDNYIPNVTDNELEQTLAPKVEGLIRLDVASQDVQLDFFIFFSSIAGVIGNPGQAGYAAGNGFMDAFAAFRNGMVRAGKRTGMTLSINWPLWEEGGMRLDPQTARMMRDRLGMVAMPNTAGIQALYRSLASGRDQVAVVSGNAAKIKRVFSGPSTGRTQSESAPAASAVITEAAPQARTKNRPVTQNMTSWMEERMVSAVAEMLRLDRGDVQTDQDFGEFGFDSITYTELANYLNESFDLEIFPPIFFEYPTIHDMANYLVETARETLVTAFEKEAGRPDTEIVGNQSAPTVHTPVAPATSLPTPRRRRRFAEVITQVAAAPALVSEKGNQIPMAVIGMSGSFPKSQDLHAFWENLLAGNDCIGEIPKDRWPSTGQQEDEETNGATKWGGFMDGVASFDPGFFGILPREANLLDPQQRLLMMHVWKAIEDSGYSPRDLAGSKTGIFIGTRDTGYGGLLEAANLAGESFSATGTVASVGPNRMSHFLGLHGPSEPIETACSSSLVAIHRAMNAMADGSCDAAIVGGVNTIVSPYLHQSFNKAGMLSVDGRCKTFSREANGYVRGEGVGMIVLKRLDHAERDGDTILGVIRGSAVNHGGRTHSLTAPNPRAQAEVIAEAYRRAGWDPATVGYIEAHGTGTELGDPIEVNGLKSAFKTLYQEQQASPNDAHCGLGSVKSHIGHLELAAGIAGVIKVLLQMKHRTLIKNLRCDEPNPFIDLKQSPFFILQENQSWSALKDASGAELPRRADVSSFGFGGVNAHVVLEEYGSPAEKVQTAAVDQPQIVILSARDEERLDEQVIQLERAVQSGDWFRGTHDLANLAYTSQIGRNPMDERLGFIVGSLEELAQTLTNYRQGNKDPHKVFHGRVTTWNKTLSAFAEDEDLKQTLVAWYQKGKLNNILNLWVKGLDVDWQAFYSKTSESTPAPRRISIPTYPFEESRYWVPETKERFSVGHQQGMAISAVAGVHQIGAMALENHSDLGELRFASHWTGQESLVVDHSVEDRPVFPGVAYLEMARAALVRGHGSLLRENDGALQITFERIVWRQPFAWPQNHPADQALPKTLNVVFHMEQTAQEDEEELLAFEFFEGTPQSLSDRVILCSGRGMVGLGDSRPSRDILDWLTGCQRLEIDGPTVYSALDAIGLSYGPSYRCLDTLFIGENRVAGKLILSDVPKQSGDTDQKGPMIQLGLLDSAFQATLGFSLGHLRRDTDDLRSSIIAALQHPSLPFYLEAIEILEPCSGEMWALIERRPEENAPTFDIDLCDADGRLCLKVTGLTTRTPQDTVRKSVATVPKKSENPEPDIASLVFKSMWYPKPSMPQAIAPRYAKHLVLVCLDERTDHPRNKALMAAFRKVAGPVEVRFLKSSAKNEAQRYQDVVWRVTNALASLLAIKPKELGKDEQLLCQIITPISLGTLDACKFRGLSSLLRTARQEHPRFVGQVIELDDPNQNLERLLNLEAENHWDWLIRHQYGARLVFQWREISLDHHPATPIWQANSAYLITGGTGGLGLIFAKEIAKHADSATLILTGRKPQSEPQGGHADLDCVGGADLNDLRRMGARVLYRQMDVADMHAVEQVIGEVTQLVGPLTGVIHAAGVVRDGKITNKTVEDVQAVLQPKVEGLVNLDLATRHQPLSMFLVFSSLAGALGNAGQSDYASANGFINTYLTYRDQLVAEGKAKGQGLSMNWPLWADGGMQVDDSIINLMRVHLGAIPMRTETAMNLLYLGWHSLEEKLIVLEGDPEKIRSVVTPAEKASFVSKPRPTSGRSTQGPKKDPRSRSASGFGFHSTKPLVTALAEVVLDLTESFSGIPRAKLKWEAELSEFGFDSISFTEYASAINRRLGTSLAPTVFFEFSSMSQLVTHLLATYPSSIERLLKQEPIVTEGVSVVSEEAKSDTKPINRTHIGLLRNRSANIPKTVKASKTSFHQDPTPAFMPQPLAIVGMSGCFPMASDLDTFWANLVSGKDCIGDIPKERWDWRDHFGDPNREDNKTRIKWGGFIDDVDAFDPLFFGISPKEAELMDPRQRLLMLYAWRAIEDAGHAPERLAGSKTAIFVGTAESGYRDLAAELNIAQQGYSTASWLPSMGPHRMSYFLNIHGPSEPVETACSSSLIAIHRAMNAFANGSCDAAIVGGVNTVLTPPITFDLSRAGMLAQDGRCKAFSSKADGYVRSEGVGMLLIKRLADAERDGNHIYGVIRSTAENHGGRGTSLTAPNPKAQAQVVLQAINRAKIDPATIGLIETHGTGTPLGDPIEIQGLESAFKQRFSQLGEPAKTGYCGLSSVKSNIGHLELSAGIAGVIKVLLQLKHKTLVKSLHCEDVNPYIKLEDTPFFLVKENQPWQAPTDSRGNQLPRRAGVSSFGFGGANAHVILEEYVPSPEQMASNSQPESDPKSNRPALILLSAKNEDALQRQAQQLAAFLAEETGSNIELADLAFTLQLGRDHMKERLAFLADSLDQVQTELQSFIQSGATSDQVRGRVQKSRAPLSADPEFATQEWERVAHWREQGQLKDILSHWVEGGLIDWDRWYDQIAKKPKRMSLPTYPFDLRKYWVTGFLSDQASAEIATAGTAKVDSQAESEEAIAADRRALRRQTVINLRNLLGSFIKVEPATINPEEDLEDYGIDSVKINQLNLELAEVFVPGQEDKLSKTLFFEYPTIVELADYFIETYPRICKDWHFGDRQPEVSKTVTIPDEVEPLSSGPAVNTVVEEPQTAARIEAVSEPKPFQQSPIAIIGISGRYPKARKLAEFWENLKTARDCISTIPNDRWSLDGFFHKDPSEAVARGLSYGKWGGFIDGIAEFDAPFFNLSPREVLNMDPHERLFLQESWLALEQAGYSRQRLEAQHDNRVGVFVGITKTEYGLYGPSVWQHTRGEKRQQLFPRTSFSSVANRVSYCLNLQGPSMPLDTMCSSSLTAIHEACRHLAYGECEMAIAGGVNLYLHPAAYISLSSQRMLSVTGRCKSFGDSGDGFVPGEGVGAVLLKPLAQAERDGDSIHGVILSSALNHGGKTHGYTVPSPKAQGTLIRRALDQANLPAHAVSYIEAHGTGTELGDPIEVNGLARAFGKPVDEETLCALGSVKSNIGHLESAAGIAALSKVLLQMKHQTLVPSLHAETLNPKIQFEATPFRVQQTLEPWSRPRVELNGQVNEYPRIAGISSFGAGGSNAHLVIQEYIAQPKIQQVFAPIQTNEKPTQADKSESATSHLILISARDEARLEARINELGSHLQHTWAQAELAGQGPGHQTLQDFAYTLQVGREGMPQRLGFAVSSYGELREKLDTLQHIGLKGELPDGVLLGRVQETATVWDDEDSVERIARWLAERSLPDLLTAWMQGYRIDWLSLYANLERKPHLQELPGYPFERKLFWLPEIEKAIGVTRLDKPEKKTTKRSTRRAPKIKPDQDEKPRGIKLSPLKPTKGDH